MLLFVLRVFRLVEPGLGVLAHTVMLVPGGLYCLTIVLAVLIGLDFFAEKLSAPSNKEPPMDTNTHNTPSKLTPLLKSTLKTFGAIGASIWAATVLPI